MLPFEDPDDWEKLNEQVVVSEDEGTATDDDDERDDDNTDDDDNGGARFSALRFKQDFSNQRSVYLACLFLAGRLPDMMFPAEEKSEKFSIARESKGFKALARELSRREPTLRKLTGVALWSMYTRLIKAYGELDKVLQFETGGLFQPSNLSEIVKTIYDLHNEYDAKRKQTTTERTQERQRAATEYAALNAESVEDCMATLATRQARRREASEEAIDQAIPPISSHSQATLARPLTSTVHGAPSSSSAYSQSSISTLSTIQQSLVAALEHASQKYDTLLSVHNKLRADFEEFQEQIDNKKLDASILRLQQTTKKSNAEAEDMDKLLTDANHDIKVLKRKMTDMEEKLDDFIDSIRNEKRRK
ncbi:hypothetical protein EC957_007542 [Mortierella hygrophila]|uniref:Uncharacterized protein n=1 Tax=Mortierella hygrophila TaxID=979708 RepID=A0A9P6EX06_9FUNG|nr:hypothetical protein EC957_007542 [Mortierella hygrophila]